MFHAMLYSSHCFTIDIMRRWSQHRTNHHITCLWMKIKLVNWFCWSLAESLICSQNLVFIAFGKAARTKFWRVAKVHHCTELVLFEKYTFLISVLATSISPVLGFVLFTLRKPDITLWGRPKLAGPETKRCGPFTCRERIDRSWENGEFEAKLGKVEDYGIFGNWAKPTFLESSCSVESYGMILITKKL